LVAEHYLEGELKVLTSLLFIYSGKQELGGDLACHAKASSCFLGNLLGERRDLLVRLSKMDRQHGVLALLWHHV